MGTRDNLLSNERLKRLRIEPHNQTYKTVNEKETGGSAPHFMAPEPSMTRMCLLNLNLTIAKELLSPSSYSLTDMITKDQAKIILRASRRSYGGMSYKRNRTLLKNSNGGASFKIQDPAEVTEEALSQLEIEAITANGTKADKQMRQVT